METVPEDSMTFEQLQRLCVIQMALAKLRSELGRAWDQSWLEKAVFWLDHEVDLEIWDFEHDLKTTEAPAELAGAPV